MGARLLYDGDRQVGVQETFTCAHCNRVKPKYTWNGRKLEIIRCGGCSSASKPAYICRECASTGVCMAYEKRIDLVEVGKAKHAIDAGLSREAFRRSLGS